MAKKKLDSQGSAQSNSQPELRRRAEKKAEAIETRIPESLSPEETRRTLHELRVHQIELEMQNEELRRTQVELEALRAKYFDLYNLAPVGYLVLSEQGLILEANLTTASLLGKERRALVKKPISRFIFPEDQDIYYRYRKLLFETGAPQPCELRMMRKDGDPFWAHIEATAVRAADGVPLCRAVMSDISERKRAEEELQKLASVIRFSSELVNLSTLDGKMIFLNEAGSKMLGLSPDEVEQTNIRQVIPAHFKEKVENELMPDLMNIGAWEGDLQYQNLKTGQLTDAHATTFVIKDKASGAPLYLANVSLDITKHKRAEAALQASEARYRLLVENAQEAILVNQDGLHKFVNQAAVEMFGCPEPEILSQPFSEFIHPDDRKMVMNNYRNSLAGETVQSRYVFRLRTGDGGVKWVETGSVQIDWEGRPATLNFLTDITDRRKAEAVIQASLREKEVMLREIHHRVKNNMQIISSLLNLQAGAITDENARRILKEGQLRIRSMALVHEKLYRSQDLSKIDFADYLQSLSDHLFQFFQVGADRVRLKMDLEHINLDVNSAVPCGLLFNELLSNALKHAFPKGREGVVEIGLRRKKDGAMEFRVADDGVGLPDSVDFHHTESFGMQIVTLLVGQLDGTIELDRKKGAAFTIVFREQEIKARAEPAPKPSS